MFMSMSTSNTSFLYSDTHTDIMDTYLKKKRKKNGLIRVRELRTTQGRITLEALRIYHFSRTSNSNSLELRRQSFHEKGAVKYLHVQKKIIASLSRQPRLGYGGRGVALLAETPLS